MIISTIHRYLDHRKLNNNLKNLVVIEGNIGAGKSTLCRLLAAKGKKVCDENLGLWNYTGTLEPGLLTAYLTSKTSNDLVSFQLLVAASYFVQAATMGSQQYYQERSIWAAWKVFLPELKVNESQKMIIEIFMKALMERIPLPSSVIFMDVDVDLCYYRVQARGRPNECVTLEYLKKLRRNHRLLIAYYLSRKVPVIYLKPQEVNQDVIKTITRKTKAALLALSASQL